MLKRLIRTEICGKVSTYLCGFSGTVRFRTDVISAKPVDTAFTKPVKVLTILVEVFFSFPMRTSTGFGAAGDLTGSCKVEEFYSFHSK